MGDFGITEENLNDEVFMRKVRFRINFKKLELNGRKRERKVEFHSLTVCRRRIRRSRRMSHCLEEGWKRNSPTWIIHKMLTKT